MNNLQIFQGHNEAIRDVSWAPNDERFCTGGDDGVIKIWNFERMKEEKVLTGEFSRSISQQASMSADRVKSQLRPWMGRQVCEMASYERIARFGIER